MSNLYTSKALPESNHITEPPLSLLTTNVLPVGQLIGVGAEVGLPLVRSVRLNKPFPRAIILLFISNHRRRRSLVMNPLSGSCLPLVVPPVHKIFFSFDLLETLRLHNILHLVPVCHHLVAILCC